MQMDSLLPYLVLPVILAIITYRVLVTKRSGDLANKGPRAPELPGAWPIIGHLPLFISGSELLHKKLGTIADEYGPIFSVRLGVNTVLVVSSPDVVKELFTTHDKAVSSRPRLVAVKHLGYNFALSGLAPYSEYWRQMRKISMSELLSNRRLDLLKHTISMEVDTWIKELQASLVDKDRAVVDIKDWFDDLTPNVILKIIAGKRYSGSGDERIQKVIKDFFRYLGVTMVRDAVPYLGWLDFSGNETGMKRTAKELDGVLGEWLEEHKNKNKDPGDHHDQDFMDVLIRVLDGGSLGGYDADTITKATSLSMIAGGSSSSSSTLTWCLCLLLNNRQALDKVREELDRCVGRKRLIAHSDLSKLPYLQAAVKEALRLYPAGPLLPARQFLEDCTVNGYHVPKDTWLIVNIWKVQTDPNIWANPFEFDPDRFLTSTPKDFDVRGNDPGLLPFGAGRRVCPGISMGLHVIHLALASFLHVFDISTLRDAPVDMTEIPGLISIKATPLQVLIVPRLESHLYS